MFTNTDPHFLLSLHDARAAELRAEADAARLADVVRRSGAHRRSRRWPRLAGRRAATRAPVHP